MAHLDVYRNPSRQTHRARPYLLDVQADLLRDYPRRVVAPLALASEAGRIATRLNPTFVVEEQPVVMLTVELASIPREALTEKVASLQSHRTDIISALDFLLTGI